MKTAKQIIGEKGETIALHYLQKKHFKIVARNHRIGRAEVDIIAETEQHIIFIEVKTRTTDAFGHPESFVTEKQKNILIEAAATYTTQYETLKPIRFDIVSILMEPTKTTISHFEDAFWPMA